MSYLRVSQQMLCLQNDTWIDRTKIRPINRFQYAFGELNWSVFVLVKMSFLQRNFCEDGKMLAFLLISVDDEGPTKTLLLLASS